MLDEFQRFAVDLRRHVGHIDEIDVRDVVRSAAPPGTARQHVAVDDDMRRPDVLVYSEETHVLQKRRILVEIGVVRSKHDVVYNVRYRETLGTNDTNIKSLCMTSTDS